MLVDTAAKTASLKGDFGNSKSANAPATWYVALLDASGTELTGTGGISRIAVANTDANWTVAAGTVTNAGEILSSTATGAWAADATQARFCDAASGGVAWDGGNLTSPVTVTTGVAVRFPAGAISIGT